MMSLIRFAPVLALIAMMSIEVSVEAQKLATLKSYSAIAEAGGSNTLDMQVSAMNAEGKPVKLCTAEQVAGGSCMTDAITPDKGAQFMVTVPNPGQAKLAANGTPTKMAIYLCYSTPDLALRKWRAFDDEIKIDKSCPFKGDPIDFPTGGSFTSDPIMVKDNAPTGFYTPQVMVMCEGQPEGAFCGANNWNEGRIEGAATHFKVEAIDSRPTNLWVAVLICVFIGPVLLAAFLIYERGVLAKQA